jgi:hypothetical protein
MRILEGTAADAVHATLRAAQLDTTRRCDFCSKPFADAEGRWLYATEAIVTAIYTELASHHVRGGIMDEDGLWAACDTCAELVRTGNVHRLAVHCVDGGRIQSLYKLGRERSIAHVEQLQKDFFWGPWAKVNAFRAPVRFYG